MKCLGQVVEETFANVRHAQEICLSWRIGLGHFPSLIPHLACSLFVGTAVLIAFGRWSEYIFKMVL